MFPLAHPYVETGDAATLEAWRCSTWDDTNTDRGRLHISTVVVGATLRVDAYKDVDRTSLVAQGAAAAGSRATLAAQNGSRIAGLSVKVLQVEASSIITLYLAPCSERDLHEREDRLASLKGDNTTNFAAMLTQTARDLYLGIADKVPPPSLTGDGLRMPGAQPLIEATLAGRPDAAGYYLWSMNGERLYELTGLGNVESYREWAICNTLAAIWRKKSMGGVDDPHFQRMAMWENMAKAQWKRLTPWVDTDGTATPDRPVQSRSVRLRRG